MQVQIAGKHMDLGESLRERIADGLEASVKKYFDRPSDGHVTVSKRGHETEVDCSVHLPSGIVLQSQGKAGDPYAALENALEKMEKRVRRYKRRLKDHHKADRSPIPAETVPAFIIQPSEDEEETQVNGDASPLIIAETAEKIRTMTVSEAVMQLELGEQPALLFKNTVHNRLNLVYLRPDGNIGWVDPDLATKLT